MKLQEVAHLSLSQSRNKAITAILNSPIPFNAEFTSMAGSLPAMIMAALPKGNKPMIVVGDSPDDAGYLYHDLSKTLGEEAVMMFPSGYKRHIKYGQPDPPSQIMRTEALNRWSAPELRYLVTYPEALAERATSRQALADHTIHISVGATIDLTETVKWLRENGFRQQDYVYDPGHFAVRGSILDIYAFSYEQPLRIDLFGDEIDSIRSFNIETQLSEARFEAADITAHIDSGKMAKMGSLFDFTGTDVVLWMRDPKYTIERIRAIADEQFSPTALLADEGDADAMSRIVNPDAIEQALKNVSLIHFTAAAEKNRGSLAIDFNSTQQGIYHKNFDLIADSFRHYQSEGYKMLVLSDSEKQFERLRAIFNDRGDTDLHFTSVSGTIHTGFIDHQTKTCVLTDHQIFDRFHKYSLRSDRARTGKLALSLKELGQIEIGDYVVHVDNGVARFGGLVRTEVNGRMQEMVKLQYANDDLLLVSIHSLHKLSKYRGKEGVEPRICRLGSSAWGKMKERTKSKLKDIARDLIKLYAARRDEKGFAFSPDSYLQNELEASFIYEDTPDQLTATQAVKNDMESSRPMDRLICGDVGFGKTEIAVRAAFKAATDGKQTAVLVPTTVLAYQHYQTFSERLRDFPVKVEYLSRARSAKETRQILADLAEGKIDILIGTHKLIGKDVHFHDLGLLIVDEEQKFGVAVKEKLKQLKVNVDTLTMSATPIPRTLQFSLMGARDLSAINTPPPNRYPILTSVTSLSDDILSEAINFEMSRNGQVFIVNPRIEGLYELEARIKALVPDARTIVAHGQLPPAELEKSIISFANHDYDVLLATTIIESGIDMPNVNTMVINNAQNFGLSELHQLRGRVGRSNRKAFCYLMVPPGLPLTPVARRRLQAIESFSELGSGIQIAMQDLDIRGAGNLLGAEQSGFIADLGYETYQRVLREAVTELKTQEFSDVLPEADGVNPDEFVADCAVESDLELLLPANYVPQASERISLYKELDSIERDDELARFKTNLEDRFGKIPHEADELLRIPPLRQTARRLGIEKVTLKQGSMYLYFVDDNNRAYYQSPMFGRILNYLQTNPRRCRLREKNQRRSMAIENVPSVAEGLNVLRTIIQMQSL
ncbi:MAG: transcription-repair coupling factor [Muribaculum sp.]|nr:transcription-repair coupling factor [Muribaculaceae bacterium]MCM1081706.1 transcription-repair coupling factor [Muribaculum sp.]